MLRVVLVAVVMMAVVVPMMMTMRDPAMIAMAVFIAVAIVPMMVATITRFRGRSECGENSEATESDGERLQIHSGLFFRRGPLRIYSLALKFFPRTRPSDISPREGAASARTPKCFAGEDRMAAPGASR